MNDVKNGESMMIIDTQWIIDLMGLTFSCVKTNVASWKRIPELEFGFLEWKKHGT